MRRADRLFQIVQLLSYDRVTTARKIADELAVSERTIYRDIQDLSLSGVPIESEAGVGYRLMKGFHLPPLMFNEAELAALMLGARIVQARGDSTMGRAAKQALVKIENVLPSHLKPELSRQDILVPDYPGLASPATYLSELRSAVRARNKITFDYVREDGQGSSRTICPLGIFIWNSAWTLVGWCELRDAFRHFRLDRMDKLRVSEAKFLPQDGKRLQDYFASQGCDRDSLL